MGTFLPFAIITSAMCIWHIAGTDSRLSRRPHATAGTARMGPCPRRTLGPTPDTRHSLGPPVVAWASRVVGRRPVAPVRRRARPPAAAGGAWRAGAALGRAGAGGARPGRCSVGRCRPGCWAGAPGGGPRTCPPRWPGCWGRPRWPWGPRAGQSAKRRGPARRSPAGPRRRAGVCRARVSPVVLAVVQRRRSCWPQSHSQRQRLARSMSPSGGLRRTAVQNLISLTTTRD